MGDIIPMVAWKVEEGMVVTERGGKDLVVDSVDGERDWTHLLVLGGDGSARDTRAAVTSHLESGRSPMYRIEGRADPEGLERARAARREFLAAAAVREKAAAEAKSAREAGLLGAYPWLCPRAPGTSGAAAPNVRLMLKHHFPGHAFSVTTGRGSGVSSVTVRWECGPTGESVRGVLAPFSHGYFDGMTDSYNPTSDPDARSFHDLFGGEDYVFEERSVPDSLVVSLARAYAALRMIGLPDGCGLDDRLDGLPVHGGTLRNVGSRLARAAAFPCGVRVASAGLRDSQEPGCVLDWTEYYEVVDLVTEKCRRNARK